MRRGAVAGLVLILASGIALSLPAFGDDSVATVTATVKIASTCLVASPNTVGFGLLSFSQADTAPQTASASISLHNCSPGPVSVLARGSTATGGGVTWGHAPAGVGMCTLPNAFVQGVRDSTGIEKRLSLLDQPFKSVPAGVSDPISLTFVPPCSGSSGGGETMTLRYIFTAIRQ